MAGDLPPPTSTERRTFQGRRFIQGKLVYVWAAEDGVYTLTPKKHRDWVSCLPQILPGAQVDFQMTEEGTFYVSGEHAPSFVGIAPQEVADRWLLEDRAAFTASKQAKAQRDLVAVIEPLRLAYRSAPGPQRAAFLATIIAEVTR